MLPGTAAADLTHCTCARHSLLNPCSLLFHSLTSLMRSLLRPEELCKPSLQTTDTSLKDVCVRVKRTRLNRFPYESSICRLSGITQSRSRDIRIESSTHHGSAKWKTYSTTCEADVKGHLELIGPATLPFQDLAKARDIVKHCNSHIRIARVGSHGQLAPGATAPRNVENGFDNRPHVHTLAIVTTSATWNERRQDEPLDTVQIAAVWLSVHTPSMLGLGRWCNF